MLKLRNSDVWRAVQEREEFKNNNGTLFGKWVTPFLYVVYSYGEHWPLFMWDGRPKICAWAYNTDKYSVTTSRHFNQAHPQCDRVYPDGWAGHGVGADAETLKAYIRKSKAEV